MSEIHEDPDQTVCNDAGEDNDRTHSEKSNLSDKAQGSNPEAFVAHEAINAQT